jgi:hypothetical protein
MSQRDLWDKAATCALAAQATSDPKKREILTYLGEFWINLANENPYLDDQMASDLAVIEKMQTELIGAASTSH